MTVPWTGNRDEKYSFKEKKYVDIQQNLKIEHPAYEVAQVTLVMDVFGGYSKNLGENISKVIKGNDKVKSIIKDMQKSIISSSANFSLQFFSKTALSKDLFDIAHEVRAL